MQVDVDAALLAQEKRGLEDKLSVQEASVALLLVYDKHCHLHPAAIQQRQHMPAEPLVYEAFSYKCMRSSATSV